MNVDGDDHAVKKRNPDKWMDSQAVQVGIWQGTRTHSGSGSRGIRPIMLPFLGSVVPAKPPVVSRRLVPPTRFNSAFSTKAIRLFGVHERTNLRVSKGIPLDNKALLGSAVPERLSCIVPAADATGLDRLQGIKPDGFATWRRWHGCGVGG